MRKRPPKRPLRLNISPRLALRRLAPAGPRRVNDADRRVVWTRTEMFPGAPGDETSTGAHAGTGALARSCARTGAPVAGVAADRMADRRQVGADLVGAPGLQRDLQQRGARQRLDHLEVGARRRAAGRCSVDMTVRRRRSRPSGASMVPRAGVRAAGHQRQVGALHLARRGSCAGGRREPRRTWPPPAAPTCRGRGGGRCPGARGRRRRPPGRASACASVPARRPAPGCTTTPAGLSTTIRCSSSSTTSKGRRRRPRARPAAAPPRPARRGPAGASCGRRAAVHRHARRRRSGAPRPRATGPAPCCGQRGVEARARVRIARAEPHSGSRRPSTT